MPLLRRTARLVLVLVALLLSGPVSPAVSSAASLAAPSGSGWLAPLAGPVVVRRGFEPPASPWGPGHRGVDLAAYAGAVVRAPAGGAIVYAGVLAGRGVLVIRHGTLRTTYEPVAALRRLGAVVARGDPVARLLRGHVGPALPGEALLHWGLLRGTTYRDPLLLLRRAPSRLIPVPAAPRPVPAAPSPVATAPAGTSLARPASRRRARPGPVTVAGVAAAGAGGLVRERRARRLVRSRDRP